MKDIFDNQLHCWNKPQVARLWSQSPQCVARKWQQEWGRFLKVCCHFHTTVWTPKDVERQTRKSHICSTFSNHSQTFPNHLYPTHSTNIHLHHPTSIKIQHSYQAASVPGVLLGCAFSDAVSLGSAAMPVSFTSATWGKEESLKPLAWYSWGWKYILMGNGLQVQDIAIESKRVLSLSLAKLS